MPGTEVMLMALVTGLYLYDSALLLYSNEAVLMPLRRGRWLSAFGSMGTTVRGKHLLVPNPLLPTRPMFRLAWSLESRGPAARPDALAGPREPPDAWTSAHRRMGRFSLPIWSLAAVLFVLLPASLTGRFGDEAMLLAFGLVYLNVLCVLVLLWFVRKTWNISGRAFAGIAFDLLTCPPFALNLIRRLSLRCAVREDFAAAARRLQSPQDWASTRDALIERLDDEIAFEEKSSPRQVSLAARREDIARAGVQNG